MCLPSRQNFRDGSMTKEETLIVKHFIDLSRQAQQKDIVVFSDFLNLNEQNMFRQVIPELYSSFAWSGGYETSERQMVAFLPDALCYTWNYPISCLKITPKNKKFADALTHRDVLGSLMNLGIERGLLGDILVDADLIYVFCQERIADYIKQELTRIRHTVVQIEPADDSELQIEPKTEQQTGIISSNRLDSIVACICNISRSQANEWIRGGKVFIDNREILHTTYECKARELISVRSVGRFRFQGCKGETKKGRLKIQYEKYI